MVISYNKLWKLLIDKKMSKADLRKAAGLAPNTMTRLRRDQEVTISVIYKICTAVGADIGDVMEFLPEPEETRDTMILNISSLSDTPDRKKSDTLTAKILHPFRIDGAWRPHGLRTAATPLDHSEIAFSRLMDSPLMVST